MDKNEIHMHHRTVKFVLFFLTEKNVEKREAAQQAKWKKNI